MLFFLNFEWYYETEQSVQSRQPFIYAVFVCC